MNDENENKQHDHWQALAEQLGLPPVAEAPAASPPRVTESREVSMPAKVEAPATPVSPSRAPNVSAPAPLAPPPAPAEAPKEERPGPVVVSAAPERRSGRRREPPDEAGRPRRGRKPAKSTAEAENETQGKKDGAQASGAAEDSARGGSEPGRRRGRNTHKKSGPRDAARVDTIDEIAPPPAEVPDDEDDDEIDNLSDWSVPSWTELIASLHRPER